MARKALFFVCRVAFTAPVIVSGTANRESVVGLERGTSPEAVAFHGDSQLTRPDSDLLLRRTKKKIV